MNQPAYLDTNLPIPERVQDLLSRLTLDEKVAMMNHTAQGVPRLGIPDYNFWSEALHGVASNGRATVFPQAIGMAATWDKDLIHQIAAAISDEGRAKYHEALRRNGCTDQFQGLTFWSPNVNIFRDPRWGRGQETWGEDPFFTGEMAAEFVKGLQGDHPRYLKVAACAKHYAVHSGPEKDRHTFNAIVSKHDLHDTYLPAFKKLVTEAKVEAVMGAYNRTLGEPCNGSKLLLEDILRGEWGFEGHVVSDCGALSDFHLNHKVTKDAVETVALALKRGCDIGCDHVYSEIPEAIARGFITEADVDRALARTLGTRFKLGMFDPPEDVPFASIGMDVVACDVHRQLAYRAATESVVLLKNKDNILPIKPSARKIFVTGPTAASMEALLGSYCGLNNQMTTLLEGVTGRVPEGMGLGYHTGALLKHPHEIAHTWAPYVAQSANVSIVCVGLTPELEGEEGSSLLTPLNGDRDSISLPTSQVDYIKELAINGAKIVLVVTGGSPIALGEVMDMVDAILFVWYPGMEGGRAVADVLFGDVAPAGRLPLTFPQSLDQLPAFDDYSMTGRTYRYMTAEPLYPFGFGLSYTTFAYRDLRVTSPASSGFEAVVTVENTGAIAADEVIQFYLKALDCKLPAPLSQLIGFQRIHLEPGKSQTVTIMVKPEMLMLFDGNGRQVFQPGKFRLTAGNCSPGARGLALGAAEPVNVEVEIM
ncbi:MAG TPA: glycoside hydrolase family 3 C-terminal domain-containing protein [Anaerolineaceae bacterium]|nr:glycoside hydrolase family 3 C-terminal domain-containing protein [Anaerolineaceae bacterium]